MRFRSAGFLEPFVEEIRFRAARQERYSDLAREISRRLGRPVSENSVGRVARGVTYADAAFPAVDDRIRPRRPLTRAEVRMAQRMYDRSEPVEAMMRRFHIARSTALNIGKRTGRYAPPFGIARPRAKPRRMPLPKIGIAGLKRVVRGLTRNESHESIAAAVGASVPYIGALSAHERFGSLMEALGWKKRPRKRRHGPATYQKIETMVESGYSYPEIERQLGLGKGTVNSHFYRKRHPAKARQRSRELWLQQKRRIAGRS